VAPNGPRRRGIEERESARNAVSGQAIRCRAGAFRACWSRRSRRRSGPACKRGLSTGTRRQPRC